MPTPFVSSFPVSRSRFGNKAQFGFFVLLFVAVTLFLQHCTGGFAADRGNHADEAAHYVSSIAIADYLATGLGSRPVAFFIDYYAHFPKVAIGHWPPFFEFLQAIVILLFGANAVTALGLQAAIAGATAAVAAAVTSRLYGVVAGLTAGLAVLLSPVFLAIPDEVMADTLGALTVAAATVCWSVFFKERSWRSCCLFAVTATVSILTKGTGLGLALMPLIDAALRRDAAFLLHPKTLAAAALVAMLTAPWYLLTYRMAADGFVYAWGWHYTRLAVPFFLRGLIGAVGLPCSLLYGYGVARCWTSSAKPIADMPPVISAFAASSLAMLLFVMLAPADLDVRYLIPALPGVVIVAFAGFYRALESVPWLCAQTRIARSIPVLVFLASTVVLARLPHPVSLHSDVLVRDIMASGKPNMLTLVSGTPLAEGAFIASFAQADRGRQHYVVRAQKALAKTSWMGDQYTLTFQTPAEIAGWIDAVGIGWIVLDEDSRYRNFPHNALLKTAIDQGLLHATLMDVVDHAGGRMSLYALPQAANVASISAKLLPALYPGHLDRSN